MVPPKFFMTTTPLVFGQFFISSNHDEKKRLLLKGFLPVSLHRAVKCQGHVMPKTVEDDTSGQLYKKLNFYITTYVQKSTSPPLLQGDIAPPHLKF